MNLLFNGQLLPEEELKLPVTNRAFQYNDGFFETMMIVNGKIRFWQDHSDRLQDAARALKLNLPDYFQQNTFADKLLHLAESNGALHYGRIKLKVWRSGAGLFTPETNATEWLATVQPALSPTEILQKVGICTSVRTNFSPLSFFKGPNSPLYIMAAMEKEERGFDDVILLSRQDLVSELISSNIFWYQQDTLYTPSLDTGCINGIMRRNILNWCRQESIKIKEAYFDVEGILQAETVFSANVTGLKEIRNLIGFELNQSAAIVSVLKDKLKQA